MRDKTGIGATLAERYKRCWRSLLLGLGVILPVMVVANPAGSAGAAPQQVAAAPAAESGVEQLKQRIAEQEEQVQQLADQRAQLDASLSKVRGELDATRLRISESKKALRQEMEELLQNSGNRKRLDGMLQQHEGLQADESAQEDNLETLRKELAAGILALQEARRDLARMKTEYTAQQRELAIQKIQEVSLLLEREFAFSEQLEFKCSPNRSLQACLSEKPLDASVHDWIRQHYGQLLKVELSELVGQIELNSDWYDARVKRNFSSASMSLDGTVTATLDISARIVPRKMMPCALLGAAADLCDSRALSLVVRSNKFGDQVLINNKAYGSTPLSLMLDPGIYHVEIQYQGLIQKRTLTLEENRHLNFVF